MKKYIRLAILIILLLSIYIINISFARYEENLKSNTITLSSNSNVPSKATLTAVPNQDNTFNVTVTNNNSYDVKYKIKEENDLYNVECSDLNEGYITIPANNTSTVQVVI